MKKVTTSKKAIRTALKQVVDILNTGTENSKLLWDILSALRGPDFENSYYIKDLTTGRIRAIIGLRSGNSRFVVSPRSLTPVQLQRRTFQALSKNGVPEHFRNHYDTAANAIRKLYGYDLETETKI